MFYFILTWLFWCAAGGQVQAVCLNANVCVASGNGSVVECQQNNVSNFTYRLSDLTPELRNCKTAHIYLTGGIHILDKDLYFSDLVEETKIHGSSHGQPTIIECLNNTGIRFSENITANKVFLSNIIVLHCCVKSNYRNSVIKAALFFRYARYTLINVIVKNIEGYGLYADQCTEQYIFNGTFSNNTKGHIQIMLQNYLTLTNVLIKINKTVFSDGKSSGMEVSISHRVICNLSIVNCEFHQNKGGHLRVRSESAVTSIKIKKSTFTNSIFGANIDCGGLACKLMVIIRNSNFSSHKLRGLYISSALKTEIARCSFNGNDVGISIRTSVQLQIRYCLVQNNRGIGIIADLMEISYETSIQEISKVIFFNNSRGLIFRFPDSDSNHQVSISGCSFINHKLTKKGSLDKAAVIIERNQVGDFTNDIILENSSFKGNHGFHGDCSVLLMKNMNNLTLSNVNIVDNDCTGITLSASRIKLKHSINLIRNRGLQGGALAIKSTELSHFYLAYSTMFSEITFTNMSKLNVINNTADSYGGGIYSDTTCDNRSYKTSCFFQFAVDNYMPTKAFIFSGNSAKRGGDLVFGGCLSNCSVIVNKTKFVINKSDPKNIFWDLVSLENTISYSTFVEYPNRVAFCKNSSLPDVHTSTCIHSYAINAYRGQKFTIPLIVVNDFCFPSKELIKARVNAKTINLEHDVFQEAQKYCHNFSYTLTGGLELNKAVINLDLQDHLSTNMPPALLTVYLSNCSTGYEINSEGKCECQDKLKSYQIECNSNTYSLEIPAQTWMGELGEGPGSIAVQKECQYCNTRETQTITNITIDSDKLCIANRTGIMCGACIEGYSLQLGGFECADCSNSIYKGVLLVIAFVIIGIALVFVLIGLNITVSTGMINGLIFYSNIVYLNHDSLLPITTESNSTHLQNTIKILSTFQAWMNLDFGIVTCFFDGYNTYISTWMQFVYPLYIWLLILMIVLASRHSKRISKITASNTVSILATLLLLSYAKILKTSIEVFSSVQLTLLDGKTAYKVWKPDANILYLDSIHVPLFLMSLVMVMVYVIPFTLLILLGPLLQAKSNYRLLNWINKLKPFLDAFYGPYTSRYRYWPGILLLARLVSLGTYDDTSFTLMAVSVMVAVLLVTWLVIGKTHAVSIHQKLYSNYLELFFLFNLITFAVVAIHITQFTENKITNQQGLAVAMVGSVLAVFCGILGYQIFCTVSRYKAMRKLIRFIPTIIEARYNAGKDRTIQLPTQQATEDINTKTTYSVIDLVEMTDCAMSKNELREPLLTTEDC